MGLVVGGPCSKFQVVFIVRKALVLGTNVYDAGHIPVHLGPTMGEGLAQNVLIHIERFDKLLHRQHLAQTLITQGF
jgi:hypothetical protein